MMMMMMMMMIICNWHQHIVCNVWDQLKCTTELVCFHTWDDDDVMYSLFGNDITYLTWIWIVLKTNKLYLIHPPHLGDVTSLQHLFICLLLPIDVVSSYLILSFLSHHYMVWLHHGYTMDTLWIHHEYTIWLYREYTMDSWWIHHGYTMNTRWIHHGYTMNTRWIHHGYTMDTP